MRNRVEDQIDGANITQATVVFGVATEKIMLLLGETGGGVPVQVNLQVNAQALHAKYAEMVRKLEETVHQFRLKMAMRDDRLLERRRIAKSDLTNTWQIDCHFVRFDAARCASTSYLF